MSENEWYYLILLDFLENILLEGNSISSEKKQELSFFSQYITFQFLFKKDEKFGKKMSNWFF